jgi:YgiT-type zinc finger domain-containing protein
MASRLQNPKIEMNNIIDKCDLCGGELKPGTTTLEFWRDESLIVIKDIPADVCNQCGEAYLSAHISEQLDHFMEEYETYQPDRYLSVPEFSALQAIKG